MNVKDVQEMTPLHYAAHHGHVDAVRVLEELGAFLEACDGDGAKPLHWAANQGRVEVVKTLIELG